MFIYINKHIAIKENKIACLFGFTLLGFLFFNGNFFKKK
jgi:hypothetical protein